MTKPNENIKNDYTANGIQTVFGYTFKIFDEDEISVYVNDALGVPILQALVTDYSVSGVGDDAGGFITFVLPPAATRVVTFISNAPYTQLIDYAELDLFPSQAHEEGLDRSDIRDLQLKEAIDRCLQIPFGQLGVSTQLPPLAGNGGKLLGAKTDETGWTFYTQLPPGVAVSSFMETVLDDTTALEARTTLGAQEDVITTEGDIIVGNALGKASRVPIGTAGYVLTSNGTTAAWSDITGAIPYATDTTSGLIELAVQSEMEAATDATRAVTPARQHFHPSAAKAWVKFNPVGVISIQASYNVSSITDFGAGQYAVNYIVPFSSADYVAGMTTSRNPNGHSISVMAAGFTRYFENGGVEPAIACAWAFGDQ